MKGCLTYLLQLSLMMTWWIRANPATGSRLSACSEL